MEKLIKIYGERNTNTNYMSKLLQCNLNITEIPGVVPPSIMRLQNLSRTKELVRDIYFKVSYRKNLGWKHSMVMAETQRKKYKMESSISVFLTITKNPYSWLLSLHRKPYHQYYDVKPSFEEFLKREWKTVGRDNVRRKLNNPIELWNIKNESYFNLDADRSLHLTTEEIFQDAGAIIQSISDKFNIEKKSGSFVNYDKSTKGSNKDSAYYRDYYLSEKWRDSLSEEAIGMINQSIDKELMARYGYEVLQ